MTEKRAGLSAMTLKYIAMATMLVDHIGYVLFPWILWLRCVGRIAFPIFAFQIAEGCIRTHDRRRYALRLLLFAVLMETAGTVVGPGQTAAWGVFGAMLLRKDAGGYVLVAVVSFAVAAAITALCFRLRNRENRKKGGADNTEPQKREGKTT